jgi:hypothetical protein
MDFEFWFLAAAIILFSDAIYCLYKRQLGLSGRLKVTFEIIVGIISLVGFLFPGLSEEYRYIIIGVGAAIIVITAVIWWQKSKQNQKSSTRTSDIVELVTEEKNVDVIQHYKSRSELPPFDKMLSIAEVTVEMSGLDFRIVVHQFMSDIIGLIHADVCVTFWLLDPESKEVDTQSKIFFGVDDLKESIHKSIRILCEEKQKLPPRIREKLIIRLYDSPPNYSIIAIDEGHENAWIKVEKRPIGSDSSSRPSDAWYRRDDPHLYDRFMREFDTMYKNSREYGCPS